MQYGFEINPSFKMAQFVFSCVIIQINNTKLFEQVCFNNNHRYFERFILILK